MLTGTSFIMLESVSSSIHYLRLKNFIGKLKLYVYCLLILFANFSSDINLIADHESGRPRKKGRLDQAD